MEISPACSLEGLILKLKLQYFGHLMSRVNSLEKTLMLGWIGGRCFNLWATREANLDSKKQRCYFAKKGPSSQGYGFSSSHIWMWELNAEELMLLKCGVGEDSCESLGLQGDQSWVFTGKTDFEAETPILWPPDAKSWLIWKDPDAGKHWREEEKRMTEDEMVGWHHQLNGHEFG